MALTPASSHPDVLPLADALVELQHSELSLQCGGTGEGSH